MVLKGKAKRYFSLRYWYLLWVPSRYLNLVILRWFNSSTYICVGIHNWEGKYDYGVWNRSSDFVYMDDTTSETMCTDYDVILYRALYRANDLYNEDFSNLLFK